MIPRFKLRVNRFSLYQPLPSISFYQVITNLV